MKSKCTRKLTPFFYFPLVSGLVQCIMWMYIVILVFALLGSFRAYVKSKRGVCHSRVDLTGKTAIVTGANSGKFPICFFNSSESGPAGICFQHVQCDLMRRFHGSKNNFLVIKYIGGIFISLPRNQ